MQHQLDGSTWIEFSFGFKIFFCKLFPVFVQGVFMFNNTTHVKLHSSEQMVRAILPRSETLLSGAEITKKIIKTENHISYLMSHMPSRNTHGGKRFRARKISIENQITLAQQRLETLTQAIRLLAANRSQQWPIRAVRFQKESLSGSSIGVFGFYVDSGLFEVSGINLLNNHNFIRR
jgi:hypothetical protein